ncbi:hypothetical protein TruAng_004399 [Truncatella angustata]|nr:hypothetical protein TruAng_004399 [Truncatella angustata]
MDALRSNLPGYYTPQQYTPVPLPTYPAPNFSAPSPYPRHHAIQTPSHLQHHQYDQSHLAHPQLSPQVVSQAQAPVHIGAPVQAAQDIPGESHADDENNNNASNKKSKGGPAPKGFGRTSAVYRIDDMGVKRRVNAEDFRAEVEERTRNGESCEQIADALIAQGAQVTSKSVSRWRILWGFRKRAVRKQSKPPKAKEERMNKKQIWQSKYKADITRMTQQGLEAEEIARIMTIRGMQLKKGSSTITRLQTVWKLRGTEESRIKNKRYLSRRKARQQQLDEFNNYARELGLDDPEEWVRRKMEEPAVKNMRRDAAFEMMGDAAPEPREPKAKATPSRPQTRRAASSFALDAQVSATDAMQDATGYEDESSDDEDLTVNPTPAARTLRSDHTPVDTELKQDLVDSDSDCSGEDAEYQPMEGVNPCDSYDLRDDAGHGYPPLSEQDDDDEDDFEDNNQSLDGNGLPIESNTHAPTLHATVGFTNAEMAYVPLPPSEQDSMEKLIGVADSCIAAAQLVKDLWLAKCYGQPGPRSLTGLPPSIRDIELARHRLKEAAHAAVNVLQYPA